MSYDINFWKQSAGNSDDPQEIYEAFCAGKTPVGVEKLPVSTILAELQEAFPKLDAKEQFPLVKLADGSMEPSWSDYHFRFDFRGGGEDAMDKVVQILRKYDCPVFDPQTGERYPIDEPPTYAD